MAGTEGRDQEEPRENTDLIKEVEDKVLLMVRKANNREVIDDKKKEKGKKKKGPVVDKEPDMDENDMEIF